MSLSPGVTMLLATALWTFLRALLFGSAAIALENLALRHQLVVLQRAVARPRLLILKTFPPGFLKIFPPPPGPGPKLGRGLPPRGRCPWPIGSWV